MKRRVSALLKAYEPELYYWMPVPGGYGESTLDYIGSMNGWFFGIETKAPGQKPTPRQQQIIYRIMLAGGKTFVISNDEDLTHLQKWLTENHDPDISQT